MGVIIYPFWELGLPIGNWQVRQPDYPAACQISKWYERFS